MLLYKDTLFRNGGCGAPSAFEDMFLRYGPLLPEPSIFRRLLRPRTAHGQTDEDGQKKVDAVLHGEIYPTRAPARGPIAEVFNHRP